MNTETILTDEKIKELFEWHIDDPEVKALSFDFARAIEQAVLAKLAEQEPRVPDGFRLVNEEELIELSDSILGNYYRGQDWEQERITNILKASPCVSYTSNKEVCGVGNTKYTAQPSCQAILDSSSQELPPLPEADVYGYRDSYSEELMLEYAKNAVDRYKAMLTAAPKVG